MTDAPTARERMITDLVKFWGTTLAWVHNYYGLDESDE